jgi:hypothetical protein
MGVLLLMVFAVVILSAIVLLVVMKSGAGSNSGSLYNPKALLTQNEQEFFVRLKQALPDHHVMAQVSMGALLNPSVPRRDPLFHRIRNRFAQKIVDYVVLDDKFKVVTLIELDDRTHVQEKDADRDAMTAAAGYRTIRYQSKAKPAVASIRFDVLADAAGVAK